MASGLRRAWKLGSSPFDPFDDELVKVDIIATPTKMTANVATRVVMFGRVPGRNEANGPRDAHAALLGWGGAPPHRLARYLLIVPYLYSSLPTSGSATAPK